MNLVHFDMSKYKVSYSISRIIGFPMDIL
nr:hypothetical protein [Wolbachia endosymbiont of Onchocerca gibsoni]